MSDRADRLRRRRDESDSSDDSDNADRADLADTGDAPDSSDASDVSDTSDWADGTLKNVGTEMRMYLPDDLVDDLDYHFTGLYRDIKHEYGEEIEKNRHFYPLVVELGLGTVVEMDPEKILSELQDREMI